MKRLVVMLVAVIGIALIGGYLLVFTPAQSKVHKPPSEKRKTNFTHAKFIYRSKNATYSFEIKNAYLSNDNLYIVVKNTGKKELDFSKFLLQGPSGEDYSLESLGCARKIAPGKEVTLICENPEPCLEETIYYFLHSPQYGVSEAFVCSCY